jgi:hypothetical protein
MPMKTASDPRTAAELEQAVLDGDNTITAEQLGAARLHEQHQALQREAQLRVQQADAKAARDHDIRHLRDDILALADHGDELRRLAVAADAALEALYTAAARRGPALDELAGRARSLGIQTMQIDDQVRDDSGLGWRRDTAMTHAHVRVDDTLLSAITPRKLMQRVVFDVLARLGVRVDGFSLKNPGPTVDDQINSQVREIVPEPTRRLRCAKRWGQHDVDAVVEVDSATARWGLDRGYFVPIETAA